MLKQIAAGMVLTMAVYAFADRTSDTLTGTGVTKGQTDTTSSNITGGSHGRANQNVGTGVMLDESGTGYSGTRIDRGSNGRVNQNTGTGTTLGGSGTGYSGSRIDDSTTYTTSGTTMTTTPAAPATSLSDGEVAKVLLTINDGEIDAAKLAKRKAQNKDVENFAEMMIDHHKSNMKNTKKVSKSADIDPKKSDMSKSLEEEAKASNKDLKKTAKADFDRTYVRQQVQMHQKALDTIDNTLLPNAKNPDLRAHLEKTRGEVEQHLNQARDLETKVQ